MAYSTSNPPRLAIAAVGTTSPNLWIYSSTDAATVVRVTGYISNGDDLGMQVGDIVLQSSSDASVGHFYIVKSVAAGGVADLSDGVAIVATDTD